MLSNRSSRVRPATALMVAFTARNGLRVDSDYPVTRQHAIARATIRLAKRAANKRRSATGHCGGMVGDAGIEPTTAAPTRFSPPLTADRGRRPVSYTHLRAHETVLDLVCR